MRVESAGSSMERMSSWWKDVEKSLLEMKGRWGEGWGAGVVRVVRRVVTMGCQEAMSMAETWS